MLTKSRYSVFEVARWTHREILGFLGYGALCTALHAVLGWEFLQIPWTPLAVVGTAVAFIVGFQNNAAYGRIWEARKIWGGIVNASRSFAMRVQDCVVDPEAAETNAAPSTIRQERRILIHRHLAWLTALRHTMRSPRPWEVNDRARTNRVWMRCVPEKHQDLPTELARTLGPAELESVVQRNNVPAAILFEQSRHLRELKERGWIWEFAFLELQGVLQQLFEFQGKSERIKNFPYPRQYATLSFYFVWVFVLLVPFAAIPQFWKVSEELEVTWPGWGRHFVWAVVPFSATMSWIFHTMERIGRVGENPFEGTPNDVPISTIARGIEIDLRQVLGETEMPEPIPGTNNVQM